MNLWTADWLDDASFKSLILSVTWSCPSCVWSLVWQSCAQLYFSARLVVGVTLWLMSAPTARRQVVVVGAYSPLGPSGTDRRCRTSAWVMSVDGRGSASAFCRLRKCRQGNVVEPTRELTSRLFSPVVMWSETIRLATMAFNKWWWVPAATRSTAYYRCTMWLSLLLTDGFFFPAEPSCHCGLSAPFEVKAHVGHPDRQTKGQTGKTCNAAIGTAA